VYPQDLGKIVRTFKPLKKAAEQFGAMTVKLTASTPTEWPHLVAVVTGLDMHGAETVLTGGGSLTTFGRKPKTATFKLIFDANFLARGTKLRVYLADTSTAQSRANLLYLTPVPDAARLRVTKVTLTVPFLRTAISRSSTHG